MILDTALDRALTLAIAARADRIRAEKALEVLRLKEDHAAEQLAKLVSERKP